MASTTDHPSAAQEGRAADGALLVVGTTSGAGKSTVVTALCRALARRGVDVAPFKAQNMSTHLAATADGGLIGRAQAMQALAARVEPDRRMGPILLRPTGERTSQVLVLGEEVGLDDAVGYGARAARLRPLALEALTSLRADHGVVVLEGAGGAAEINLLDRDLVNLPLAAAAGVPAVLVVDIERGGAFAAAYGTWALLPERLRSCLCGFVVNAFRGDVSLLDDGLRDLTERTGVPVLGVLPHLGEQLMLGLEDSLDLTSFARPLAAGTHDRPVRVAVVRVPRLADPYALDPLVVEPAVELRWATRPGDLADADLVVLPTSGDAEADEAWLGERGLDRELAAIQQESGRSLLPAEDRGEGARRLVRLHTSGVFEDDDARRALLTEVAAARGRTFEPSQTGFAEAVEAHLEHLADWVETHLDVAALLDLAGTASPVGQEPGW